MKLTAYAERGDGCWVITVPEIDGLFTQVKRLDQARSMVRDAAGLLTGQPEDVFAVEVIPIVALEIRNHLETAARLFSEARETQHDAAAESRAAAQA